MRAPAFFLILFALFLGATAHAGITNIKAHDVVYGANDEVPLFVDDDADNVLQVIGQFPMFTSATSTNDKFVVRGVSFLGSSFVDVRITVKENIIDQTPATITLKFAGGSTATFKVRAHKMIITSITVTNISNLTCAPGDRFTLTLRGDNMIPIALSAAGRMLEVVGVYKVTPENLHTQSTANFTIDCLAAGRFTFDRTNFAYPRAGVKAGPAMVRGTSSIKITVQ